MRYLLLALVFAVGCAQAQRPERGLPGFATDTSKRTIPLDELQSGGPPKDGIPSIDRPEYVSATDAERWVGGREPVVLLRLDGAARIYPLQILTWHEIVNDTLAGRPIAVTFCPLCYSAVAFDRRVGDDVLEFGVSGLLRFSDLVMFDRQTETLWQQFTGDALVGDYVGTTLDVLPAQIVSFEQARQAAPTASVLSRETGYDRDYGRNPYVGYDDVARTPLFYRGETPDGIAPMARVVALEVGDGEDASFRLYPADGTRRRGVTNDVVGDVPIVVLHTDGATTALGEERIADAREVGTTGAFRRRLRHDGVVRTLTFRWADGVVTDAETKSTWSVTGRAVGGALDGATLTPVQSHDTFAFAWFAFRPDTSVFEEVR